MARPASGGITERRGKEGIAFQLRFSAYGKRRYVTLGTTAEGWTRERAETKLRHVLADVERGLWRPHEPEPVEAPGEVPTFHEFASDWFAGIEIGRRPRTVDDYRWALVQHLLPYFKDHRLDQITAREVDAYATWKLKEGKLGNNQINKTLVRLSTILEQAVEYELIDRNPAKGKKRRVTATKTRRSWVEPEQAMALIEHSSVFMRPVVATLLGTGMRVGELVALEWDDIVLSTGTIKIGESKTDAGTYRELDLPLGLVDELHAWYPRSQRLLKRWNRRHPGTSPVFLSEFVGEVRRQTEANVSRRLKTSIRRANGKLAEMGIEEISERVTPHSLRRTYSSVHAALGDDPLYVSEQMGHSDIRFTLNVYSRAVKRRAKLSGARLAEFDRMISWASLSTAEPVQNGASGSRFDEQVSEVLRNSA